ncbi:MAG: transporter substrate-binding domain-containing protein, partial [Proteobacteria bacterium]|nr:transporter substrate-binding domain-containing protein [Pseudomonadota bacterium]
MPIMVLLAIVLSSSVFTTLAMGKEKSVVKVGVYENRPRIFTNPDGNVAGFWPDLLAYIAKKENWEIRYVPGTWNEGLDRLVNNTIDIMPDVALTQERNKRYAFSEQTVLMSWSRLYVKEQDTGINAITDLENKTIAVLAGSVNFTGADGIKEIVDKFNIHCSFLEFDSYDKVFEAVDNNLAHAGVTNNNFGDKNQKRFNVKKTAVYDSSGKLVGVLGIARDITDRKKAEQEKIKSQILAGEHKKLALV